VTITVNGCTSAAGTTNVVVNAIPATPTASNGGPYCAGATISLSTATVAGATYSWTGPNGFTSSVQNPTRANATAADAGTYSVTITVNGCPSAAGTTNVVVLSTVTVAVSPASVPEDGASNLDYTFTRNGDISSALTVNFSIGGTASFSSGDYSQTGAATFDSPSGQGTVSFAAGAATATVTIDPTPDGTIEPDETVILTVTTGTSYMIGSPNTATAAITNDDIPSVSAGDGQTAEPASGTSQLLFTIALSAPAPAAGASVNYATAAGGANPATAGAVCGGSVDYQTTSGSVNFAPGEQIKTIVVPVCADGTSEPDETLLLNLSSPTSATISDGQATGTI